MFKSRFPEIIAELPLRVDEALVRVAERVEADAKARVPVATGRLRDAIHVEPRDNHEVAVVAGDAKVFYGHLVEHGTKDAAPRPFLVPSLEQEREGVTTLFRMELRDL